MNMESKGQHPTLAKPIIGISLAITVAAACALALTVLSFGVLSGVGVALVSLVAIICGLWLLLHRESKVTMWLAGVLILGPFAFIWFYVVAQFVGVING